MSSGFAIKEVMSRCNPRPVSSSTSSRIALRLRDGKLGEIARVRASMGCCPGAIGSMYTHPWLPAITPRCNWGSRPAITTLDLPEPLDPITVRSLALEAPCSSVANCFCKASTRALIKRLRPKKSPASSRRKARRPLYGLRGGSLCRELGSGPATAASAGELSFSRITTSSCMASWYRSSRASIYCVPPPTRSAQHPSTHFP